MANKVLSYEDKQYKNAQSKRAMYDCLYQIFQDIKHEKRGSGWNLPVSAQGGMTMKLIGTDQFTLTYHRVETGTLDEMAKIKTNSGPDVLRVFLSEFKKRFKKSFGKTITIKKMTEDQQFEQYGRMQADTSYSLGSNRAGLHSRPVCKFFVRDTTLFSFDTDVE